MIFYQKLFKKLQSLRNMLWEKGEKQDKFVTYLLLIEVFVIILIVLIPKIDLTVKGDLAAAVVAVIFSGAALFFSIIIHFQARSLMKRTERPIISLFRMEGKIELSTLHVKLTFKNIGRNPAEGVRISMVAFPKGNLVFTSDIDDSSIGNRIDPEGTFPYSRSVDVLEEKELLLYVLVNHVDIYSRKRDFDYWYLKYTDDHIGHADGEDVLTTKSYFQIRKIKDIYHIVKVK